MTNEEIRLKIYEIIATPAHLWLWLCAKLVGGTFECGPTDEDGNLINKEPQ